MELFRETLNHTVQKILLWHGIFTFSDKLKHFWKNILFVDFNVNSFKTWDSHKVFSDKHFKIILLFKSFSFVSAWTDSHPKICSLSQVGVNNFNGFFDSSCFSFILASCIGKSILTHFKEVISKEKTSNWVLNSFHHLKNIFKDSVWALIVTLNINTSDGD